MDLTSRKRAAAVSQTLRPAEGAGFHRASERQGRSEARPIQAGPRVAGSFVIKLADIQFAVVFVRHRRNWSINPRLPSTLLVIVSSAAK
jgi:hypothetical protein